MGCMYTRQCDVAVIGCSTNLLLVRNSGGIKTVHMDNDSDAWRGHWWQCRLEWQNECLCELGQQTLLMMLKLCVCRAWHAVKSVDIRRQVQAWSCLLVCQMTWESSQGHRAHWCYGELSAAQLWLVRGELRLQWFEYQRLAMANMVDDMTSGVRWEGLFPPLWFSNDIDCHERYTSNCGW